MNPHTSFYSLAELTDLGFAHIGRNVSVSRKCSVYGAARISLGDHTRIDDFCMLSAGTDGFRIGRYVHLACYSALIGQAEIVMDDFSGLSSRVIIYSSSDDYSGAMLTNPTVPAAYTRVQHAPVHVGRHVIIGAGSVVLPGVKLAEGVAVGALSMVHKDVKAWAIVGGVPARVLGERKRDLLAAEAALLQAERE